MKLRIAIPALNEEDNIESIIQRSLASRWHQLGMPQMEKDLFDPSME